MDRSQRLFKDVRLETKKPDQIYRKSLLSPVKKPQNSCEMQHGAPENNSESEAVGKSWVCLNTKMHTAVDVLVNPVRLTLTVDQAS